MIHIVRSPGGNFKVSRDGRHITIARQLNSGRVLELRMFPDVAYDIASALADCIAAGDDA